MAQVNLGHVVGPGVPTGGAANQVLVKNGATNFDTSWKDLSQLPAISDEATERDAADAALADGLAIIANGDTHAAVAAGQAVYVRSHSTLAAGLYWASSAIGTNAALSTSNLTADSKGGLNKLKGDIDSLNSNIATVNSNLADIGKFVELGSHQGTGTFSLSQSVKSFRFLYVMIGYYASGYPQYGQALIPASRIAINASDTYGIRIVSFGDAVGANVILFPTETECRVVSAHVNTWYFALYGIK